MADGSIASKPRRAGTARATTKPFTDLRAISLVAPRQAVSARALSRAYREGFYLEAFKEVATAVADGQIASGLEHFLRTGRAEIAAGLRHVPPNFVLTDEVDGTVETVGPNRQCRLHFGVARSEFDTALYAALFPDIAAAVASGTLESLFLHWLEHGYGELASGRRCFTFQPGRSGEDRPARNSVLGTDYYRTGISERPGPMAASLGLPGTAGQHRSLRFNALMARPFGINVFGPLGMESGLGTVARGMLRAILAAGIEVDVRAYDTSNGCQIMPADLARQPRFRINLLLANADYICNLFDAYPAGTFDDAYNIAVWQWELQSFRPDYMPLFINIDEVWTSSQFEVSAISALSSVPVHLVPAPVRLQPNYDRSRWQADDVADDAFMFITILDLASRLARKNPLAVIRAFREVAVETPGIVLLIKFHGDEPNDGDRDQLFAAVAQVPGIRLVQENMSEEELARLRERADCLVSAHRSEGFGLNIAEFLACGKPVIATGYSGNLDFFDSEVGYPIEYDLVELDTAVPPYPPGYIWAEPRHESLVAQMRRVLGDAPDRAKRGAAGAARMARQFDVVRIGEIISERLAELELSVPQPHFMRTALRGKPVSDNFVSESFEPEPALSVLVAIQADAGPERGQTILDALCLQAYASWELVLRPDSDCGFETLDWLDRMRGSSTRVRVLTSQGPGLIEASTTSFVVFIRQAEDLPPSALAAVAAILATEPACDMILSPTSNGRGLVVVRKSLLLTMGEASLQPSEALGASFQARVRRVTCLWRSIE